MTLRPTRTFLTLAGVLSLFLGGPLVGAQKEGAPGWYSVVSIKRVQKPNRKPARPLPRRQNAPLLTLQWYLLKRVDDDTIEQADPTATFQTGSKIKLSITANQDGYLYVVNQPEGKDAVVVFPDPRINNGQNSVAKDTEYVIPGYCPEYEDPKDCWFQLVPPAGRETMLVILSRERITSLPDLALKPYAIIPRASVEAIIKSSAQKVAQKSGELTIPGGKVIHFATRAQNTNPQDNEELIAKIEVNHGE